MTRKHLTLFTGAALLLLACATVNVVNNGTRAAVVQVTLPDEAYGTTRIEAGGSDAWIAAVEGPFTVTVLPDEEYIASIREIRENMSSVMLDPVVLASPSALLYAIGLVEGIEQRIANLEKSGTACSGEIPEMESIEDEPLEITVTLSLSLDQWSCTIN
jgi:hypothetical protein